MLFKMSTEPLLMMIGQLIELPRLEPSEHHAIFRVKRAQDGSDKMHLQIGVFRDSLQQFHVLMETEVSSGKEHPAHRIEMDHLAALYKSLDGEYVQINTFRKDNHPPSDSSIALLLKQNNGVNLSVPCYRAEKFDLVLGETFCLSDERVDSLEVRTAQVNGVRFYNTLRGLIPMAATADDRKYLMGIHIQRLGNYLRLTGTNGHLVGLVDIKATWLEVGEVPAMIIPTAAAANVVKLMKYHDNQYPEVSISCMAGKAPKNKWESVRFTFRYDAIKYTVFTGTVDGLYPNVVSTIARHTNHSPDCKQISVNAEKLLATIKKAHKLKMVCHDWLAQNFGDTGRAVSLFFDGFDLSVAYPVIQEPYVYNVFGQRIIGDLGGKHIVNVNYQYIKAALKMFRHKSVTLEFTAEQRDEEHQHQGYIERTGLVVRHNGGNDGDAMVLILGIRANKPTPTMLANTIDAYLKHRGHRDGDDHDPI